MKKELCTRCDGEGILVIEGSIVECEGCDGTRTRQG